MQHKNKRIRLFLLEDHVIFRQGLAEILSQEEDFEIVGGAGTVEEAVTLLPKANPDILLLDLRLPGTDGLELLPKMKELSPRTRTIVLTGSEHEKDVEESMRLGAHGYVLKHSPTALILKSIRRVADGEIWLGTRHLEIVLRAFQDHVRHSKEHAAQLSPREKQIIQLVISGCKNKDIAGQLFISEKTVKNHLSNIFDKLGVSDRLELALYAFEKKLFT